MALWRLLNQISKSITYVPTICHSGRISSNLTAHKKFCTLTKVTKESTLFFSSNGSVFTNFAFKTQFHVSACRKALPPLVLLFFQPIARFIAVVFGRTIRVWWRSLPQNRKEMLINRFKRHRYVYFAVLAPITAGTCYFVLSHIEEDPVTKRRKLIVYSQKQMIQLAEIQQATFLDEYKDSILHPSHPLYTRVVRVANRLLDGNKDLKSIHELNWTVTVVNEALIKNAFVLPNGSIFIFTGMLSLCANDDQLGVILAHEISHAILHHMAEILSTRHLVEILLFLPILMMWAILPDFGALFAQWTSNIFTNTLFHLPFSRSNEIEADEVGLQLAAKACFDVREASAFWGKMRILECSETTDDAADSFEWLSTHPNSETRQVILDTLIPSAIQVREHCKCPKLPLNDPRMMVTALLIALGEEQTRIKQGIPVANTT